MKKLITSAVAALALLFGFASCSGDLHDKPVLGDILEEAGIIGSINDWKAAKMTKVDESTYTYTFVATEETAQFSVQEKFDNWNSRWCGNNSAGVPEAAETTKIEPGCDLQKMVYSTEADPTHVQISGLSINSEYRITVKIEDPSTKILSCKIELAKKGEEPAPTPYYLDGMYLVGGVFKIDGKDNAFAFSTENLIWGASTNKKTGVVTYTKDIKAIAASGELGINDSSWNNKQLGVGVTIAAGAEEAVALNGTAGNFNVTGLTVGKPYRVEISTTPEKVISIKIYEIAEITLSFKVKGLNEGDSAWINGSMWGDGWPQGWPIVAWNSNDAEKTAGFISAHPAAVADASGVATFDAKWNTTFISKIGDTKSWECKVVYIEDGASWDGEGTVKDSGDNLKFDYNVTAGGSYTFVIDAANGWEISVE